MRVGLDEEVEERLVREAVAEIDHATEVVRERGLKAGADVGVDLLAEMEEPGGGAAMGSDGASARRVRLAGITEATATAC